MTITTLLKIRDVTYTEARGYAASLNAAGIKATVAGVDTPLHFEVWVECPNGATQDRALAIINGI